MMWRIIKTRNTTAVRVKRIKSLDMIDFAVFTFYEYKYQLQLLDLFLLPSLLIKGSFRDMNSVSIKCLRLDIRTY